MKTERFIMRIDPELKKLVEVDAAIEDQSASRWAEEAFQARLRATARRRTTSSSGTVERSTTEEQR